jgi:hypothetical protein
LIKRLLDANWQVPNSNSGGVIDGIGNRGRLADIGEFAETIILAGFTSLSTSDTRIASTCPISAFTGIM